MRAASSIFVGPAAVIGERAPAEKFGIVGRRFIGEQHEHFAFDVDALEIVPMKLGRDYAVADEDRFGVELILGLLQFAFADEIVQPFERDGLIGADGGDCRVGRCSDAHHRYALEIRAVFAGRFCAGQCELCGDIVRCKLASARSHSAPFQ